MKPTFHYLAGFLLIAVLTPARAEEGGMGHYAPGSFASFVDVLPGQPAIAAFNYFTYYSGSAGAGRQFPIAGRVALNVDATSYADSVGSLWVTPLKLFGGYFAPGFSIPIVNTKVTAQLGLPRGRTVSRSDSVTGIGAIEFWPIP